MEGGGAAPGGGGRWWGALGCAGSPPCAGAASPAAPGCWDGACVGPSMGLLPWLALPPFRRALRSGPPCIRPARNKLSGPVKGGSFGDYIQEKKKETNVYLGKGLKAFQFGLVLFVCLLAAYSLKQQTLLPTARAQSAFAPGGRGLFPLCAHL